MVPGLDILSSIPSFSGSSSATSGTSGQKVGGGGNIRYDVTIVGDGNTTTANPVLTASQRPDTVAGAPAFAGGGFTGIPQNVMQILAVGGMILVGVMVAKKL